MSIFNGVAGKRGHNPIGAFIHNDAGNKNAEDYRNWLPGIRPENGFAHDYVCSDGIVHAEDDINKAWHCGDTYGNSEFYSVEVCQSMGDLETFKANEEKALDLVAQKFTQYGIIPNNETVRLHQEVYATSCPHRSIEIHGGVDATKAYFIQRISELMNTNEKQVNATIQPNTGSADLRLIYENVSGDIYRIRDKEKGYYLTAAGKEAGSNVDFRGFDCGDYQKWKIVKKQYKAADYVMFESIAAPGLFLSVEKNGIGSNNLKIYTDLHNQKQKFFIREESDNTMIVMHAYTMKAISAKD